MDFYNALKTLNSAQASWQVALAVVLGMVSGFLPFISLISLVVLLVAFSINVPLVIYFLSTTLFGSLALVLDPAFSTLGYEILTYGDLKEFFTALYNNDIALWSGYNFTTTMGSVVVSSLFALPLFFLLNRFINKYRDTLEAKFKNSKMFGWLNPYTQEKLEEKPGVMRLWGVFSFFALSGTLVAILFFALNPALKIALEMGLSKALDKEVTLQDVQTQLSKQTLLLHNLRIISKDETTQFDTIKLQLNAEYLGQKKLDFEVISLGNITTTSHQKVQTTSTRNKSQESEFSAIALPPLPDVNNILEKEDLESTKALKQLKKDIATSKQKYKNILTKKEYATKTKELEHKLQALQTQAKHIKSLDDLKEVVAISKEIQQEIKTLNSEIKQLKKDIQHDKVTYAKHLKNIKTLPKKDYETLKNRYTPTQENGVDFVGRYFSSTIASYLDDALEYYKIAQPYLQSDDEEKQEEQTTKVVGQYIEFVPVKPYPDYVVHYLEAKIIKPTQTFALALKDLSSDQKIYKKPLLGVIKGESKEYRKFKIAFTHNMMEDVVKTKGVVVVEKLHDSQRKIANNFMMKQADIDAKSNFIIYDYKKLDGVLRSRFYNTQLDYSKQKTQTDKVLHQTLAKITTFKVDGELQGSIEDFHLNLSTDLDAKISQAFKSELKARTTQYKKELHQKIDERFTKELQTLNINELDDITKVLHSDNATLSEIQGVLKDKVSSKQLKKDLEKKLTQQKKNKLKKKLKSKTKKLKKKFFGAF